MRMREEQSPDDDDEDCSNLQRRQQNLNRAAHAHAEVIHGGDQNYDQGRQWLRRSECELVMPNMGCE